MPDDAIERAADALVADIIYALTNRKVLEHAWESIDEDTQYEIRGHWKLLAMDRIKEAMLSPP